MTMQNITRRHCLAMIGAAACSGLAINAAQAQTVEEFYTGKTVTMIIGSGPAANNDLYARVFAKYLTKYIPGHPVVVAQNMPAAGGIVAATQMANTQPRDGTVIASVMRGIPSAPLLSDQPVEFDSRKLNWLGSLSKETNIAIVWHTSPVMTFDDVFTRETVMGTTGGSSDSNVYALFLNQALGTKFKIVGGYPGGNDLYLAMEREEVEGRVSTTWTSLKSSKADWIENKQVRIIAQIGLTRNPELPDVPNVLEYVKDSKTREIYEFLVSRQEAGSPFLAPPDVPADRLAALRKAFSEAAADPEFRAEIEKMGSTVEPMTGEALQGLVEEYYAAPPELIEAVRGALYPK